MGKSRSVCNVNLEGWRSYCREWGCVVSSESVELGEGRDSGVLRADEMMLSPNHRKKPGRRRKLRADLSTIVFLILALIVLPFYLEDSSSGWTEETPPVSGVLREDSPKTTPVRRNGSGHSSRKAVTGKNSPVRFLHMNVQNYFVAGEPVRSRYKISEKPDVARDAVASVIASAEPDIVGLCEIGGSHALEDLKKRLEARGREYPYAVVLERPGEPRGLGVLSVYPITKNASRRDVPLPGGGGTGGMMLRGILDVVVRVDDGREFRILEVHLKSKFNEDDRALALRRREAMALRLYLDSIMKGDSDEPVVVAGDFNDGTAEAAVYLVRGSQNSPSGMQLLKPVDSRGTSWTIFHDEGDSYHAYDHILINKVQKKRMGRSGSLGIVDIPESAEASDHRAIWVDLR